MKKNGRILIIEDDTVSRQLLKSALFFHNYETFEAATGEEGLIIAAQCIPDVVLLDLGLPDIDGLEVATRIREWMDTPIIVLSSREREEEKVAAFDAGVDDYMTKPIRPDELQARIRVALRHARMNALEAEKTVPVAFEVNGLHVDLSSRKVVLHGKDLRLTTREYRLLAHLVKNAGKVMTHYELLIAVWGEEHSTQTNYLRVYIRHLRNKIETDPDAPEFILTESGIGYRIINGMKTR